MNHRRLPLLPLALLALALSAITAAHAKSDWQKFDEAEKSGNWAKAAKLIPLVETSDDRPEVLARFATVREHLGDHAAALRYRERLLWHPKNHPTRFTPDWAPRYVPSADDIHAQHLSQVQTFAAYALSTRQTSEDPCIAAYARHLAGDTPAAIAALRDHSQTTAWSESVGFAHRAHRELFTTHFKNAFAKKDWPAAAALAHAIQLSPPDTRDLPDLLHTFENTGDHAAIVRLRYRLLWTNPADLRAPLSPRHTDEPNPELLKEVAALAHRHGVTSGIPLLDAWTQHLSGDTPAALAELEKIAATGSRESPVALFLCGDLWLERKDHRNALSAYHHATYAVFDRLRARLTGKINADTPEVSLPWQATRFHRTLGTLRQAHVLLLQNKPGLAEHEVQGLQKAFAPYVTGVWDHICAHPDLAAAWTANIPLFNEAEKHRPKGNPADTPFEKPTDYRPYVRDDIIFSPAGELTVRTPAAKIYRDMAETDAIALARSEKIADQLRADQERERKRLRESGGGASRFVESYIASQQRVIVENSPPPATGSAGFNFQGALDANQKNRGARRCATCLGSGKAGYVTGAKYQSTTTGQEVAAPACSSCNGTGWR